MPKICILTDSTAQLPHPTFAGHQRVKVMPADPASGAPPTQDAWMRVFSSLARSYDAIVVITLSGAIAPLPQSARQAATQYGGRVPVSVIDSLNIGAGLGLLVQMAAESAEAGHTARDIEALVRSLIPHLYSIYCVQSPSALARWGLISPEQATATEILGIMPILAMEEGRLAPFQKVRTTRHLLESFQEFVGEYDTPRHIAFSKGRDSRLRLRPLRQFVTETFPNTPFTEHILPQSLAALLGETAVGLVVLDNPPRGI